MLGADPAAGGREINPMFRLIHSIKLLIVYYYSVHRTAVVVCSLLGNPALN